MKYNVEEDPVTNKLSWKINLNAIHNNFFEIIDFKFDSKRVSKKYENKLLCLLGEKSLGPIDHSSYLTIFPNFREENIVVISNANHWVHFDNPEETLQAIKNFIN